MNVVKSSKNIFVPLSILLVCCFLPLHLFQPATVYSAGGGDYSLGHDGADEVTVATVNGTNISMAMLLRKMRDLAFRRAGQQEITPIVAQKLRGEALDILITEELAFQKSFAKVGHIAPEAIEKGLLELTAQYGGADGLAAYLKNEGISRDSYRSMIERNLVVREFIKREFDAGVDVSVEEIDSMYPASNEEKTKYITQKETIQVAEIKLFLDPDDPASLKQAELFRQKLLTEYGGDLDKMPQDGTFFVTRNVTLRENGDKALYAAGKKLADAQLEDGFSEPVISGGVVKIVQLTGHTPEIVKSVDALRSELKQKKKMALVKQWAAGLKDGAKIEIFDMMQ